ncbi:MAG: S8 family serine peptidase [Acidimicrobiia bacterium]
MSTHHPDTSSRPRRPAWRHPGPTGAPGRAAHRGLALGTAVLILVASIALDAVPAASPAGAMEPPAAGAVAATIAAAAPDPAVLDVLEGRARATGTTRAILGLRMPLTPEGALDAPARNRQRAEIAQRQDVLARRLAAFGGVVTRRFTTVPYVAVELPARAVTALRTLPEAGRVATDDPAPVALAESTAVVESTRALAVGDDGAGQTVAIIDTGIDKSHPFLSPRVVSEACFSDGDCPNGTSAQIGPGAGVPCLITKCDHGTHVAGIVAGRHTAPGDPDGVAPAATLISINAFSTCSTGPCAYETDLMAALEHVHSLRTSYAIAAVNMSIGGDPEGDTCDGDPLKAAIDTLISDGIATVVASGNGGSATELSAPACISTSISVGSTHDSDPLDSVSPFTNSALSLDLLAPGQPIRSSVPGGGYENKSGTSMAAPHVAGAWALLKADHPTWSVATVLSQLKATGVPVFDPWNELTKPRLLVSAALGIVAPGVPRNVSAQPGLRSATVSFLPPLNPGSHPLRYVVTTSPGGAQTTGTSSPITVTGLSDETTYTFEVTAVSDAGTGPTSAPTDPVTTPGIPGVATAVSAVAGYEGASVSFTSPADDGGAPVTGYVVTASPGAGTAAGATSPLFFDDLSPATAYTFTVRATNGVGTGEPSAASNSVTPLAFTAPGAPTGVTGVPGDGEVVVSFTAPASDGGSPISGYTVHVTPGDATVSGSGPTIQVGGLTNGVAYSFAVSATNVIGTGAPSAPSVPVTLVAPLAPPASEPVPVPVVPDPPVSPASTIPTPPAGTPPAGTPAPARSGYWMVDAAGHVYAFGDARHRGEPAGALAGVRAVDLDPTPSGEGYWVVDDSGRVHPYGDARIWSGGVRPSDGRVTSVSATPSGNGYWLFTDLGHVIAFGDAVFFGDLTGVRLNGPVLDSIATPSGRGYYLVATDGGIFTFGAAFHASLGSVRLNRPVTGMVRFGDAYLMVGEDGGIFNFSSQPFSGSLGASPPADPVVSVAVTPG